MKIAALLGGLILAGAATADAQAPRPVTVDNFVRAESDLYFGGLLKDSGGALGKFNHRREVASVDHQTVIRLNRDTMYSSALFDLDAGPVKITLPDAGKRFRSMQVISQDHYVPMVVYAAGAHTLTREKVGTRYAAVGIRALVDPNDAKDVHQVHALQDATKVEQKSPGKLEAPSWDPDSQKKVRDALLVLASTLPDFRGAFGAKGTVDPVRRLTGAAAAWGGNPDKDAVYLNVTPAANDGTTVHKVTVNDVPVDAFWSISVYNAEGYYQKNELNAYTINSITGKKGPDGSTAVQFGACDGKIPNCIPIVNGWNYTVRLYRPRPEILSGKLEVSRGTAYGFLTRCHSATMASASSCARQVGGPWAVRALARAMSALSVRTRSRTAASLESVQIRSTSASTLRRSSRDGGSIETFSRWISFFTHQSGS